MSAVPDRGAGSPHAWSRGALAWDAYFGIVIAVCLIFVQVGGSGPERDRIVAGLALLAAAGWFVLLGRRLMYAGTRPAWGTVSLQGAVYLTVLCALLIVMQTQGGPGQSGNISIFILLWLYPQCFMSAPVRGAIAAVVVFSCVPVVMALLLPHYSSPLRDVLGTAVLDVAFAVAFGGWVQRIVEQSRKRADLIDQLESTRAELAEVSREAGMLAERQRLAGEIHDTIAQGFTSIVMLIQAAETELGGDDQQARRHLALARETARENLDEARALVAALAPAQLTGHTLDGALRSLADQAADELGIRTDFVLDGSSRSLATGAEVVLLRVCQEAMANVRKHADARQASIRLTYSEDAVQLEVRSDGTGFDPARVNGGYGLRGMRARADEAGGSLAVCSAPGEGTSVSVEVPG